MTIHENLAADTAPVTVRVGTPEDVHAVMDVALMCCSENALSTPNPEKLLQDVWAALNFVDGICGIIGKPGCIVEGVVVLRVANQWYSDERLLEERAVFVRPDYRSARGGRAGHLVRFSKQAADFLGMPLTIGILSNSRTAAKIKLYSRLMGPPSGAYWIYGATTGNHGDVELDTDDLKSGTG